MIKRNLYLAYVDKDFSAYDLISGKYQDMVFLYLEGDKNPNEIISRGLKQFPDKSIWFPMTEVFHYSKPFSAEHWRRKIANKTPELRVAFLKPECVSEYIFYHYQLQEEKPCLYDKYGMIFSYGNMLIMYLENPCELEDKKYVGKLHTKNSPPNFNKFIDDLFIPFDNNENWKIL